MKFFQIELSVSPDSQKPYPTVDGQTLQEGKEYFDQNKINMFQVSDNAPFFDYFSMTSISYKGAYDWILLDVYAFAGKCYPLIRGWMISLKFKNILDQFSIGKPFRFYPARVMYQGNKYDYYIFHLAYNDVDHIIYERSTYQRWNPWGEPLLKDVDVKIKNKNDYIAQSGYSDEGHLITKHTVLNQYEDFFWLNGAQDFVVSEFLKNAIEEQQVSGLHFQPLDHIQFEFVNDKKK